MRDEISLGTYRSKAAEIEARRVSGRELARWLGPGLIGIALVFVVFLGLCAASTAADDGTYIIGFLAAGLALIALAWELYAGALPGILVEESTSLVVLIGLLTALAIAGLVFAAQSSSVAVSGSGYAACAIGVILIFANLKHYFDRREAAASLHTASRL